MNTFPVGTGPILLADVECTGLEQELAQCPSVERFWCSHEEDVRIVCIPSDMPPGKNVSVNENCSNCLIATTTGSPSTLGT